MKRKKWTGAALCIVLGLLTACGVAGQTAENDAADMAMETGDSSKTEEAAEPGPADSDVNRTESAGAADSNRRRTLWLTEKNRQRKKVQMQRTESRRNLRQEKQPVQPVMLRRKG